MPGSRTPLLLLLVACLLIALIHAAFAGDHGRHLLIVHRAALDRYPGTAELGLALHLVLLGIPACLCLAQLFRELGGLGDWAARVSPRRWLWFLSLGAPLLTLLIGLLCTHFAWFTDDEQIYRFQARLYAAVRLTEPVLQPRQAVGHHLLVDVGERDGVMHWTGVYPILQPFFVALSNGLRFSLLSQLVCVSLIVFHTGRLAEELFNDARVGVTASALVASSPMLLGLATTVHSSVLATALSVLAARCALHVAQKNGVQKNRARDGLALGFCVGLLVLARPLEGVLSLFFVVLLTAGLAVDEFPRVRRWLWPALWIALGGLVPLLVFVWTNYATTGQPFSMPYRLLEAHAGRFFGFGEDTLWGRGHSLIAGLGQTVGALVRMNNWLFAWPVSLIGVVVALMPGYRRGAVWVLVGMMFAHLVPHVFFPFGSVTDFGSAYHVWHLPWVAVLTAHVIQRTSQLLAERAAALGQLPERLATLPQRFAVAMTFLGLVTFWPIHLRHWKDTSELVLRPVRVATQAAQGRKAVVLWRKVQPEDELRSWVFRPPAPDPDAQLLWLRDVPTLYDAIAKHHPDRVLLRLRWKEQTPWVEELDQDATVLHDE